MTDHLPDVELTSEQHDRAVALWTNGGNTGKDAWKSARLIVYQQDRIAELTESLRQQESNLRTALDELRQPTLPSDALITLSMMVGSEKLADTFDSVASYRKFVLQAISDLENRGTVTTAPPRVEIEGGELVAEVNGTRYFCFIDGTEEIPAQTTEAPR